MADFGLNLLGPKYAFFVYYSRTPPGVCSADGCINILASSCRGENLECLSVLLDFGSGMGAAVSLKEKGSFLR